MPIRTVHSKSIFTTALMSSVIAMTAFAAGQAKADVTDQLLDQLKAKGILTKGEYAKLKERHAAEKVAPPGPAGRRVVTKEGVVIVPDDRYVTRLDKGIGMHIGQVDVKVSGILAFFVDENFKTHTTGTGALGVVGGLSGTNSTINNSNAIRSGLLPSEIAVSLSTNQEGYDLSATFGAYIGGNNAAQPNGPGNPVALGSTGIDFRQVFGTIGTPQFGTVKIGRDLGLFGADAILNDATLFGSGTLAGNAAPGNTSLGRIGYGYIYADWIPQVTYTTPDYNGFTASIGIFTPYDAISNGYATTATISGHDAPQIQGQLHYKGQLAPDTKIVLWTDALWQQHRANIGDTAALAAGTALSSWGIDGGAKLDWGPVSLLAYGYYGEGLGTTGLFIDAFSINGQRRNSYGGYAQASYNVTEKFMLGASWGISYLQRNSFDAAFAPILSTQLRSNESWVGFARYKLTNWMNIQAEYIHSISRNQSGGSVYSDELALGTVWFF